ncbi:MAG: glycosyltransferase family 2 protein [Dehalococcoidia bacterium]|nr:glycosyltransferase family 2 protein [Dehalococcoidia bacterium]
MALPFVTVIVPARNEERYIERCLYSLAAQDYPRARLEVLLLDGMSTDDTTRIVGRFAAESTLDLRLIENPRRKPAAAMNTALRHARGDVIVRLDAHAAAAPDFLTRSIAALEASGADCVGGVIESEGDTPFGRAVAIAMASRFGVGGASFRTGGEPGATDTVAFGAYRADVFERIGGFAEDIDRGEDDEFNYRLLDAGGMILLDPRIRAMYTVRGDLGALWRQYFGYGRAKPEVLRRHPAQARARQLVPAAFLGVLALTALSARSGRWQRFAGIAGTYAAAVAAASLLSARNDEPSLRRLPAAFACLHLAYGLGFFVGTADVLRHMLAQSATDALRAGMESPT